MSTDIPRYPLRSVATRTYVHVNVSYSPNKGSNLCGRFDNELEGHQFGLFVKDTKIKDSYKCFFGLPPPCTF